MKSVAIGLTNVVYSELVADVAETSLGAGDGYAIYGTPSRLAGAITANFSPNASNDTLFADDGPYETASAVGAMTLELNVADIEPADKAFLLGATYANGVVSHSRSDVPPYVAIGMAVKKSNGYDRYIWYLKGKFAPPDDSNQTKADSINWNTPTISGNFITRDCDGQWKVSCDTDDVNVSADTKATWFASPNVNTLLGACAATTLVLKEAAATVTVITAGTTTIELAAASPAGATIEYKLSTETAWHTYATALATTGYAVGKVVLNTRVSKTDYAPTYRNHILTVSA